MIHIISPHLGDRWKSIQGDFIKRNTDEKYNLIIYDVPKGMQHLKALLLIPKLLLYKTKPVKSDMIVLFDSDCFPISKDWVKKTREYLKQYEFIAVQRLENPYSYKGIPHPCFCCWNHGTEITFTQIAGNPYVRCYEKRKWMPIRRTNKVNYHRQLYAVYGDIVYHHGAGSRDVSNHSFFKPGILYYDKFFENPDMFIASLMKGQSELPKEDKNYIQDTQRQFITHTFHKM